jgi:hypothetical protein
MTTAQFGATILKPVARDPDGLVGLLQSIGDDVVGNTVIPFTRLPAAHFLSWFIIDRLVDAPILVFELNVDGPIESFLRSLVAEAGPGLAAIYGHCEGYPAGSPADPDDVVRYLLAGDIGYDCYYIGWRGLTVDRILRERELRRQIEAFLDRQGEHVLTTSSPAALRKLIQDHVAADPTLAWVRPVPPRPFLIRYRNQVLAALQGLGVLALIGLLALAVVAWRRLGPWPVVVPVTALLALAGGFVGVLRWKEETDSVSDAQPDHSQVMEVTTRENEVVQNHFASIAACKPGWVRWIVLKSVLKLIHVLAAIKENQGSLSGISTIHFARWVVIDGGRNLLFLSNYDGSWENYLDDFIDRASPGLTAIWSNTTGFPKTSWLVNGGSRDELLFKTLVRGSQMLSRVWYSAYPDLSVQNIATNAAIREGLFAPLSGEAEREWLKNF